MIAAAEMIINILGPAWRYVNCAAHSLTLLLSRAAFKKYRHLIMEYEKVRIRTAEDYRKCE